LLLFFPALPPVSLIPYMQYTISVSVPVMSGYRKQKIYFLTLTIYITGIHCPGYAIYHTGTGIRHA
jgi:hypothetical protein